MKLSLVISLSPSLPASCSFVLVLVCCVRRCLFLSLFLSLSLCLSLLLSFSVTLIILISRLIRCTALPSLLDRPVRIDLSTGTTFLAYPSLCVPPSPILSVTRFSIHPSVCVAPCSLGFSALRSAFRSAFPSDPNGFGLIVRFSGSLYNSLSWFVYLSFSLHISLFCFLFTPAAFFLSSSFELAPRAHPSRVPFFPSRYQTSKPFKEAHVNTLRELLLTLWGKGISYCFGFVSPWTFNH